MYVLRYAHAYTHTYICTHVVWVYGCMHVCIYACMLCNDMYVYMYVHTVYVSIKNLTYILGMPQYSIFMSYVMENYVTTCCMSRDNPYLVVYAYN